MNWQNIRVLFDPWLTQYTVGAVLLPADPPHHWHSLSAHWWVCLLSVSLPSQLHVCDHALPSRPFSCPASWDRIQKQDGFMAHHFYYGYLLLPCCVGKTNVVRFRLEMPAKPSRAACGSLSQQHPCLDGCRGSKQPCYLLLLPLAYWYIAPKPWTWIHGLQVCRLSLRWSCCICTCWAGSRSGTGDCH